ncbi:MAG: hypothetical protein GX456_13315 [Verrucomicrobia bacterium]|nr:hypothetical protein [Verrucomicrobiota bacterium]
MAPLDLAGDPDGFSHAAADAVGVGRREALGVRQLAAALFFCTNNEPGTLLASSGGKTQTACLSPYLRPLLACEGLHREARHAVPPLYARAEDGCAPNSVPRSEKSRFPDCLGGLENAILCARIDLD